MGATDEVWWTSAKSFQRMYSNVNVNRPVELINYLNIPSANYSHEQVFNNVNTFYESFVKLSLIIGNVSSKIYDLYYCLTD